MRCVLSAFCNRLIWYAWRIKRDRANLRGRAQAEAYANCVIYRLHHIIIKMTEALPQSCFINGPYLLKKDNGVLRESRIC